MSTLTENFKIPKKDGNIVSCARAVPDDPKAIVIAVHGFSSSKEGATYTRLLRRLPEAGYGVIAPDLPGHGMEESAREELRIGGALDSIEAVEKFALAEYPGSRICYFGSSFGAYLTGLYCSEREHAGRQAFWRCPAVNMPALFNKEHPTEKERQQLRDLETKGWFDTDMDLHRPVRVTRGFYNDLLENDLFEKFDPDRYGRHRFLIAHGLADTVIDPAAVKRFSEEKRIPVIWFEGEGHSLSEPGTPDRVVDLAIGLYS